MKKLQHKNINNYDKLLIVLIALQAFGGIDGALQPVRLFIILFIPFTISFILKHRSIATNYRFESITFYLWIIYGLTSLIWVISPQESIKELFYLFVYFFGFFLMVCLSYKANRPTESIIRGWILLFLLTVPIALVELILDVHLPSTRHEDNMMMNLGGGEFLQRRFASVTYGNLNGYNTVLVYITPFVVGNLFRNHGSTLKKIFAIILVVILGYLIVVNSSRAAIICFFVALTVLLSYSIKSIKTLVGLVVVFLVGVGLIVYFNNDFFAPVLYRMQEQGVEDGARSNLIRIGIDALVETNFFGVGAGNFTPTLEHIYGQELAAPHNFFLEVVVQYGLVLFVLFIGLFIRIIGKVKKNRVKAFKYIVISSLLMYPVSAVINSGYLSNAWSWLFIASLYIIADKKYDKNYG